TARALFSQSLAIRQELGDRGGIAWTFCQLGRIARRQGDHPSAHALLRQSWTLFQEIDEKPSLADCTGEFARLLLAQGHSESAARLLGAEEALRAAIGYPIPPSGRAEHDETVAFLRAALGQRAFAAALAAGRALTPEQAIAPALET